MGNALDPNRIQMACILIVGIDKQESVTSNRSKFCKFNWVGAKVKAKNKGRALEAKRKVASIYHGISMDLDITDIGYSTKRNCKRFIEIGWSSCAEFLFIR